MLNKLFIGIGFQIFLRMRYVYPGSEFYHPGFRIHGVPLTSVADPDPEGSETNFRPDPKLLFKIRITASHRTFCLLEVSQLKLNYLDVHSGWSILIKVFFSIPDLGLISRDQKVTGYQIRNT
jgi:hypothetical protein